MFETSDFPPLEKTTNPNQQITQAWKIKNPQIVKLKGSLEQVSLVKLVLNQESQDAIAQNKFLLDICQTTRHIEQKIDAQTHIIMKPINALRLKIYQVHADIMMCINQQVPFHLPQQEMNFFKPQLAYRENMIKASPHIAMPLLFPYDPYSFTLLSLLPKES